MADVRNLTEQDTPDTEPETDDEGLTEQERTKRESKRAYSKATSQLRELYKDEFNDLLAAEMRRRGIDWRPQPSPMQLAKRQLEEILAAFPQLREQLKAREEDPSATSDQAIAEAAALRQRHEEQMTRTGEAEEESDEEMGERG
jgi:hypothetical protein